MSITGQNILMFIAHPDDEVMSSGTLAKLVKQGNKVIMVVATSGNKGTHDAQVTPEQIAATRKGEMEKAANVIGISEIIWLGYNDGELDMHVHELKDQVYRLIRTYKPAIVFGFDGFRHYEPHPDHRTIGLVTLEAVYLADGPWYFPEHMQVGLAPHWTPEMYMFGSTDPNYWVDVRDTLDIKAQAAAAHGSQWGVTPEKYIERMKERLAHMGRPEDDLYKEGFHRFRGGDVKI